MKLAIALLLFVAGCKVAQNADGGFGGGGGGINEPGGGPGTIEDLAVPLDLDMGPNVGGLCSASTVQSACGGGGACVACLTLAQSGVCVYPCQLSTPVCPSGLECKAVDADGGSASLVYGGACGGYDGICQ